MVAFEDEASPRSNYLERSGRHVALRSNIQVAMRAGWDDTHVVGKPSTFEAPSLTNSGLR